MLKYASTGASRAANTGLPTQPKPRLASVIPSCVAGSRVEVMDDTPRDLRPVVVFGHERFELRVADFDEGELSRDEKALSRTNDCTDASLRIVIEISWAFMDDPCIRAGDKSHRPLVTRR